MKLQAKRRTISLSSSDLVLSGAKVAISPWRAIWATLLVREGKIAGMIQGRGSPAGLPKSVRRIELKDHLILPGLINAHDHLHFGMFPRLGRGPYANWRKWAEDIYHFDRPPLIDLLKIPKETRLWSGIVRNALAGVTTVCHHDAPHNMLSGDALPVKVHSEFGWAHSVDDPEWTQSYRKTPLTQPFIIHCAEGIDDQARREMITIARNVELTNRLVLIHAVGISRSEWIRLRAAGAWIVWCPTSNLHILGQTLARELLLSYSSIVLGSDSPISADGDLLDEVNTAFKLMDLPFDLLYRMVTTRPASLLRLSGSEGTIMPGGAADLLIAQDRGRPPCESLCTLSRREIGAVMCRGEFVAASTEFFSHLCEFMGWQLLPHWQYGLLWHVAVPPEHFSLNLSQQDQIQTGPSIGNITIQ